MAAERTVVVVDDEPITRVDLSQMLEGLGFSVVGAAADGFDAVELCRARRPDLVLMDIKMPTFDGLTASDTIIREGLAGCVVLLTAFSDEAFVSRAAQIGVAGYLVKPLEEGRLRPALEVALAQSRRLDRARREAEDARRQVEDGKIIDRAKLLLAREEGIPEGDAYRKLQRMAMDKRCSILSLAQGIVARAPQRAVVGEAKARLMQTRGLSEAAAFRALSDLAKKRTGGDLEAAARQVLEEQR